MKKIQSIIMLLFIVGLTSCNSSNEIDYSNNESNKAITPDIITEIDNENEEINQNDDMDQTIIIKEFSMDSFVEVIDGKYFPQFSMKDIEVNKGDLVRISINNTKGVHDFKLDEFGVFSETPEAVVTVVEFIADKTGTFEYYCSKPNHRKNGQWGKLTVK